MARRHVSGLIGSLLAAVLLAGPTLAAPAPAVQPTATPSADPVRLAVLAEDVSPESRVLADLLTIELAAIGNVETVERSEIERVLGEHKLTAEGLTEASTRVQLGRILRAAGLAFVQREVGGDRILIRLVETRGGFVAGFSTWPAKPHSQAVAIAATLDGMLPRLGLDLSRQTAVSLLRFSTALLPSDAPHPLEERFEALMTAHLMEHLCKESGIVVTERRKLGDVAREKQLSAGTGELTVGVLLVDGELMTSEHLRTPDGDEMVTLTVRIRDMASGSQTPVVQSGARKDLGRLMVNAAEAAADAVLKRRQARQKGDLPQGEAESLLLLARQKRIVWAGEAAYALDPTNKVVQDAYLKSLLGEASFTQRQRAVPRDIHLKMAFSLARAEQVAREQGISLWVAMKVDRDAIRRNLEHAITHSDPEIMKLLRLFRATMRRKLEAVAQKAKDPVRKGFDYATLVEWSVALYDTPEDRMAFISSLFNRVATEVVWEGAMRDFLVSYLLSQHGWPSGFLAEQGTCPDPVRGFYGRYGLMCKTFDPPTQRAHAREALNALSDLLQHPGAFGSYLVMPRVGTKSWLSEALQEICARYPDYSPEVKRTLFTAMREMHAAGNHRALYLLQPAVHLRGLPGSEVVSWLDEVVASRAGAPQPEYLIGKMFQELASLRQDLKEKVAQAVPPPAAASRFRREVLLQRSTADPAWRMGGGVEEIPHFGPRGRETAVRYVEMYGPHRLLIDGDTLWIGVAGECTTRRREKVAVTRNRCGLVKYHLPTRTIRSTRSGWLESPVGPQTAWNSVRWVAHNSINYMTPLHPLARWRGWIVMAYHGAGIVLFPVDSPAGNNGLSDVILLDTDNGLPVNHVNGWTTLGSTLYILLQDRFVMTWDADTRALVMLFDNMWQITGVSMPEHDKFTIDELWADATTQQLFFTGQLWQRHGTESWSSSREGPGCLTYHPVSAQWSYAFVKNMPQRPAAPADPRAEARKTLEAEGRGAILDVAVWQGRILALIASDESWRLELLTEE